MRDDAQALELLEQRRCTALMAADADGLELLLAEDLVHIHLNGHIDPKLAYLEGVRRKYRFSKLVRGPLTIRFFGEVAVMTGLLTQTVDVLETGDVLDVRAMTTQVWHRHNGTYLLNTCHNAPLPRS